MNCNMKNIIVFILFLIVSVVPAFTQNERNLIRQGNSNYKSGKFKDAEISYRKALQKNDRSFTGKFNLGDALYKQKNFKESARLFSGLPEKNASKAEKSSAYHNLGNSLMESKQYDKSIDAFKQALINNPKDPDTRYNLAYAQSMMKQQQKQQQQNPKNQQQKQDKKQQDKQKQEQQKDQQKKDKNDQQKKQDQNKKISKEDAERMLEALKNDEKKTLEKLKKMQVRPKEVPTDIDW